MPSTCHPWAISPHTIKSLLYQLLRGTQYLHTSYVQHRDLKPANIMLSSSGKLSIGDLGLARIFLAPPHPLYSGDKVVVTIWYRAPELLLGSRHYTTAVDMWAIGCIFAELLGLRPIFKGEEAKMERKSVVPWQKSQMGKILDVFGTSGFEEGWRDDLKVYPEWSNYSALTMGTQGGKYRSVAGGASGSEGLKTWYVNALATGGYDNSPATSPGTAGFDLLRGLLRPNPTTRLSAKDALTHPYFRDLSEAQKQSCLDGDGTSNGVRWPKRKITQEDGEGGKILLPQKRGVGALDEAASATGTGPGRLGGVSGVGSGVMSHGLFAGQAMTTGAAVRATKRLREG
jgi:cyclin-dependent kinase 8/11